MDRKTQARQVLIEVAGLYGCQIADVCQSLVPTAGAQDTLDVYTAAISGRFAEQVEQLTNAGMSRDLAELWVGAAIEAATERLKELFPGTQEPKPSTH